MLPQELTVFNNFQKYSKESKIMALELLPI